MIDIDIAITIISNIVQHQNRDVCDWLLAIILRTDNADRVVTS